MLNEDPIFWPIYMTIMLFVFGIAYGSIITKKSMVKFKEYKLEKRMKINIQQLTCSTSQDKSQKSILPFNNSKYNGPLLTGIQMVFLGAITFILGCLFHFFWFYVAVFSLIDDNMILYQTFIFRRFVLGFLFHLVFPLMYLATKKDLQRFIILMLKNLM